MAAITRFPGFSHLRGESSTWLLHHTDGRLTRQGRGLSFWFLPLTASITEIPMDDRELPILFHGRSSDYQDVSVQAVLTWRVQNPEVVANRVDFTLDLTSGSWHGEPLEQVAQLLTQLAQQLAWNWLAGTPVREILTRGVGPIRSLISDGLSSDDTLAQMGIEVVSVRISAIRPDAETERALQTPAQERILQEADEARFGRRALAVEKERAIAENELQNEIELARREESLIAQRGQNEQRRVSDDVAAKRVAAEAHAERKRIADDATAAGLARIESAKNEAERDRIAIYEQLPPEILMGLAARELAGNLPEIDTLNLSPDVLGSALQRWMQASAKAIEAK